MAHRKIWFWVYAAVAAIEILAELTRTGWLVYCSKPLLMPVLAIGFVALSRNHRSIWQLLIMGALTASFFGDVFLMFANGPDGTIYFLLGLGSFFLAQVQYIMAFGNRAPWLRGHLNPHWYAALPVLVYLAAFLWILWPGLSPDFKVPVVIYGCALATMVLCAINLRGRIAVLPWRSLLTGAVLFLVSDSLIAINKFVWEIPVVSRFLIMFTYVLAQWYLANGALDTLLVSGPRPQKWHPHRQTT